MVVYKNYALLVTSPANSPFFIFSQFPKPDAVIYYERDVASLLAAIEKYEDYARAVLNWRHRFDTSLRKTLRDLESATRSLEKQFGADDVGLKVCRAQIRLIEGSLEGQL